MSQNPELPNDDSEATPPKPKRPRQKGGERRKQRPLAYRHHARVFALQVLYEVDVTEHPTSEVLARLRAQQEPEDRIFDYLSLLVGEIELHSEEIDAFIAEAAPAFPIAQLPVVDRNVLRVAVAELLYHNDVPPKAAINEAIDIAKNYGGDNSGRFVNGVLGTIFGRIEAISRSRQTEDGDDDARNGPSAESAG